PDHHPPPPPDRRGGGRRGEETYAEVALGDDGTEPGDAPEFGCDPALLETVTRAVTAGAAVATVWEEVVLHASGARRLRARLTPLGADRWTLEATDESGMPVVSARSWTAAPVRPEDVGAGAAADAMYRVVWTAAEPSETPPGRTAMAPVASPEDVTAFAGRTAAPAAAGTHTGAEETGPDGRRHSRPATAVLDVAAGRAAQPLLARVLAVLQAWQHEAPADARLVVVTRGAVPAGTTTVTDVPSAAVWGLVRAAQAEMPDRILLLDLDPATATDAATAIEVAGTDPATVTDLATVTDPAAIEAAGAEPAAATGPGPDTEVAADVEAAVAAALATGEPQVAVRGTALLLPRLAPAGPLAERNPEQPALDPDGTVLI
ncbi:SpnB-like Rossmann fold domain-containing protein, partial [Streptomyces tricolor]